MKNIKYILFGFFVFGFMCSNVYAVNEINIISTSDGGADCSGLFTGEALDLISDILNWIRIAGPIVMILLTGLDFAKVVISEDPGASSKKIMGRVVRRGVAVVLLFLLPTVVRFILNLDGVRGSIQIPSDPLCGTMKANVQIDEIY